MIAISDSSEPGVSGNMYILFVRKELNRHSFSSFVIRVIYTHLATQPVKRIESLIRVETYSIHGSFLKLEYLKTEFTYENSTYAILKVTSHSCGIRVNLLVSGYLEVIWHLKRTYLDVCRFLAKCQDSSFT